MKKLLFSFDIGHASIGWAVLDTTANQSPSLKGAGTVLFPTDDCLARTRRQLRRQRRHIRSTRMRIARMKRLLAHLGVLSPSQLDEPGGPWPWKLASRVNTGGPLLSWRELWDVLRWYAHNRGYDGNRKWSRDEEEDTDDTEKVKNARFLLDKFGKATMCETICAKLKIDPRSDDKQPQDHAAPTSRLQRVLEGRERPSPTLRGRHQKSPPSRAPPGRSRGGDHPASCIRWFPLAKPRFTTGYPPASLRLDLMPPAP